MRATVLALTAVTALAGAWLAGPGDVRIVIVGDVLLSRQVAREIARRRADPFAAVREVWAGADLVLGNFEGAVGEPSECVRDTPGSPCFTVPAPLVEHLAGAGFTAMGVENNHASDLGAAGRGRTRQQLVDAGITAIDFDSSPWFFRLRGWSIAVVALNEWPGADRRGQAIPSFEVASRLRLARALADVVVVSVHWGNELVDWPTAHQQEAARWLVDHGATIVAGHHPHLVQGGVELADGVVFYSLGNHLFDQRFPETKQGMVADCVVSSGRVTCRGVRTAAPPLSSFPSAAAGPVATQLAAPLRPTASRLRMSGSDIRAERVDGGVVLIGQGAGRVLWRTRPMPVRAVAALPTSDGPLLLSLEDRFSTLDNEHGARPRVYEVTPNGLVDRWRGSGLSWPLVDAQVMATPPGAVCALHRGDSFILPDPATPVRRIAVYRWNGFGFSALADQKAEEACRQLWEQDGVRIERPDDPMR